MIYRNCQFRFDFIYRKNVLQNRSNYRSLQRYWIMLYVIIFWKITTWKLSNFRQNLTESLQSRLHHIKLHIQKQSQNFLPRESISALFLVTGQQSKYDAMNLKVHYITNTLIPISSVLNVYCLKCTFYSLLAS